MAKTNLIQQARFWQLYQTLSDSEADDFAAFVTAGSFMVSAKTGKLAKTLYTLRHKELSDSEIYQNTFGPGNYNEQVLRNYLSELGDALKQFLAMSALSKRPALMDWMYVEGVRSLAYQPVFEKLLLQTDELPIAKTTDDMYAIFRQRQLVDEYAATQAHKKRYDLLQPAMEMLTDHYLTAMMRMYCELVNRKSLRAQDFDEEQMHFFLHHVTHVEQQRTLPLLTSVFRAVLHCLLHPLEDDHYEQLTTLLHQRIEELDKGLAREICLYAQNYCIRHINLHHTRYLHELLALYDFMIKHDVISEGPFMTQYTFKNYVTLALRLQQYASALQFIESQQHRLHESVRSQAAHYNLAAVYFEQGDHNAAMDELFNIQMHDPVYYLDSRAILLKIYFAQHDLEAVGSLYHAIKAYLLRNKQIPRKQAELYRNLFMLSHKLILLQHKWSTLHKEDQLMQKSKLTAKISASAVANKPWLLSQLEHLDQL